MDAQGPGDGLSFEAANARHEHEYHVWETVTLPDDRRAAAGGDHPRQQHRRAPGTDRRAAHPLHPIVGRENVVASTDCGFSSQATYRPEVDRKAMWAKFDAMRRRGARIRATLAMNLAANSSKVRQEPHTREVLDRREQPL